MSFKLRAIQPKEFVGDEVLTITTADSRYATKTEVSTKAEQADLQSLRNLVNLKADKTELSNYMTLTTDQSISGRKTFTTSVFFNSGQYFNNTSNYIDVYGGDLRVMSGRNLTLNSTNGGNVILNSNGRQLIAPQNDDVINSNDNYLVTRGWMRNKYIAKYSVQLKNCAQLYAHQLAGVPNSCCGLYQIALPNYVGKENVLNARINRPYNSYRWEQEITCDWYKDTGPNNTLTVGVFKWYDNNIDTSIWGEWWVDVYYFI